MIGAAPIVPERLTERQASGGRRLERIMGLPDAPGGPMRSAVVEVMPDGATIDGVLPATIRIEDVSKSVAARISSAPVAVQVLWQGPVHDAGIFAGRDPDDADSLVLRPAHPGETLLVPAVVPFAPGAGSIALLASGGVLSAAEGLDAEGDLVLPPTHGLYLFQGYNRRTICIATPGLMLERWKITSPLTLEIVRQRPLYLLNLVQPVALTWAGGMRRLGPLEAVVLPDALRQVTVVPNGLGYLLIASDPDLAGSVVPALSAAGYPRRELHVLGIPPDLT